MARFKSNRIITGISVIAAGLMIYAVSNAVEKRGKVIDFDDEVVEGMNKRPLDSLSQISERDKKQHKPHLYRKRTGYRVETGDTLRTVKFTP